MGGGSLSAKTSKNMGNMYTTWVRLALLGKNQSEIEYYFRNIDQKTMEKVKQRLRFTVLDNLTRSGLMRLINKTSDQDDLNIVEKKIITEIRYAGMEHDENLQLAIKEKFGVSLQYL